MGISCQRQPDSSPMRLGPLLKQHLVIPTYKPKLLLWEVRSLAVFLLALVPEICSDLSCCPWKGYLFLIIRERAHVFTAMPLNCFILFYLFLPF